MALSNWASMAFDNDGRKCVGQSKNEIGTTVEIYKNYLIIRNEKMWIPGCELAKPVIGCSRLRCSSSTLTS